MHISRYMAILLRDTQLLCSMKSNGWCYFVSFLQCSLLWIVVYKQNTVYNTSSAYKLDKIDKKSGYIDTWFSSNKCHNSNSVLHVQLSLRYKNPIWLLVSNMAAVFNMAAICEVNQNGLGNWCFFISIIMCCLLFFINFIWRLDCNFDFILLNFETIENRLRC